MKEAILKKLEEIRSDISMQRSRNQNQAGAHLASVAQERNHETDEDIIRFMKVGFAFGLQEGRAQTASEILKCVSENTQNAG